MWKWLHCHPYNDMLGDGLPEDERTWAGAQSDGDRQSVGEQLRVECRGRVAAELHRAKRFSHQLGLFSVVALEEARRRGRRFIILADHPLRTSSRKLKLYTVTEAARFFFRMLFTAGRAAKRPENCDIWYDGRR